MNLIDFPTNDHVSWAGTRFGLHPTASETLENLYASGSELIPQCLAALEDEERFVAAHVALTHISKVKYSTHDSWNGLEVILEASGETKIAPGQRWGLKERWEKWVLAESNPEELPE